MFFFSIFLLLVICCFIILSQAYHELSRSALKGAFYLIIRNGSAFFVTFFR